MTSPKRRRLFKLTSLLYKQLKAKNKIKRCSICGKTFRIGDRVRSVPAKPSVKWFCMKCVRKYNIW